jgi:glycerol-3-phosphate dehydrogenase
VRHQVTPADWSHHRDQGPCHAVRSPRISSVATAPSHAAVLALAEGRPELLEPVIDGLPYTGAELLYAVREEMAQTWTTCWPGGPGP